MGIMDKLEGLKDKAEEALEKTDIDDKIKAKAQGVLDKTDIDEKLAAKAGDLKDKAEDMAKGGFLRLDGTDVDFGRGIKGHFALIDDRNDFFAHCYSPSLSYMKIGV